MIQILRFAKKKKYKDQDDEHFIKNLMTNLSLQCKFQKFWKVTHEIELILSFKSWNTIFSFLFYEGSNDLKSFPKENSLKKIQ